MVVSVLRRPPDPEVAVFSRVPATGSTARVRGVRLRP